MVCSVGFLGLTFLAEAGGAGRLDGEGRKVLHGRGLMRRQMRVSSLATGYERRSWVGKNSSAV